MMTFDMSLYESPDAVVGLTTGSSSLTGLVMLLLQMLLLLEFIFPLLLSSIDSHTRFGGGGRRWGIHFIASWQAWLSITLQAWLSLAALVEHHLAGMVAQHLAGMVENHLAGMVTQHLTSMVEHHLADMFAVFHQEFQLLMKASHSVHPVG